MTKDMDESIVRALGQQIGPEYKVYVTHGTARVSVVGLGWPLNKAMVRHRIAYYSRIPNFHNSVEWSQGDGRLGFTNVVQALTFWQGVLSEMEEQTA